MTRDKWVFNEDKEIDGVEEVILETPELPGNKQLVLEQVSATTILSRGGIGAYIVVRYMINNEETQYRVPFEDIVPGWYGTPTIEKQRAYVASAQVKVYPDVGSTIKVILRNVVDPRIIGTLKVSLSGYFE